MNNQENAHEHHILPLKTYLIIGATLLFLTVVTVVVSFFHFGAFNLVVAMVIASAKAILVALFFMHLLYDNKLFLTIFTISLAFVSVFIILTMFDTLRRGDIDLIKDKPINEKAVIYQAE